jgi:hypothetical protein
MNINEKHFLKNIPPLPRFDNNEFIYLKTGKFPHGIFKNLWG